MLVVYDTPVKVPEEDKQLAVEEQGLVIANSESRATSLRSKQARTKVGRGVKFTVGSFDGSGEEHVWSCKIWVYALERASHANVMFELPHLAAMLNSKRECDSQWWKRGIPFWETCCTDWGLGDGHYQRGTQGARKISKESSGVDLTGREIAGHVFEPASTAVGAVVGLLHSAVPLSMKEKSAEQIKDAKQAPGQACHRRMTLARGAGAWRVPTIGSYT